MHLYTLQPVLYFSLANSIIIAAIYTPRVRRKLLLLPAWASFGMAFLTLHHLPWSKELLSNIGIYLVIASLLWPVGMFTTEPLKIELTMQPEGRYRWNFHLWQAYRIYNNPRRLPLSPTPPPPLTTKYAHIPFALTRLFSSLLFYLLRHYTHTLSRTFMSHANPHLSSFHPSSLSPFHFHFLPTTLPSLSLRLSITLYWLVESIAPLQIAHFLVSIIAVSVLRLDAPEEWPPLFASPTTAYSLRRFWGRFWHGLFSPGAVVWARVLVRKGARGVGLMVGDTRRAGGARLARAEKVMVPLLVFSVSGMAHAVVGWRIGDYCVERDWWFYFGNFVAIFGEVVVSKAVGWLARSVVVRMDGAGILSRDGRRRGRVVGRVVGRALGYIWVFLFLLWALPLYLLPKVHQSILIRMEREGEGQEGWD